MKLEVVEHAIVLVGDINPMIFQPYWLALKGLIQESESENASVQIIHNEIVKFNLDWASFEINRKRFQIRTTNESHFLVAKDIVISIFKILKHTPLEHLGINSIFHYSFEAKDYLEVGKRLAPFNNWEGIMEDPRLMELEMKEQPRKDSYDGHYLIRVSPSELIQTNGVSININDHFKNNSKPAKGSEYILSILSDNWANSIEKSKKATDILWKNLKI